jgi:drug/metabolite transporter (DMT)-like permease
MIKKGFFVLFSMSNKLAYLFVFLASIIWASTAAVSKLVLLNLNNFEVLFYSSFFAALSLLFFVIFSGKYKSIRRFRAVDYAWSALLGFIGVFLYYVLFYGALMFSSAQEAFIMNYTWPIWVVIFSFIILKEKISFLKIMAVLISFFGVYLVATKGSFTIFSVNSVGGILMGLGAGVCYGLFSILGKKRKYEETSSMLLYYLFALIFISIIIFSFFDIRFLTLRELMGVAWLGIFVSGIAFVLWFFALRLGNVAKMSNFIFLTPFLSLVYIYFLLGEEILISSFIGLIFIVLGIIIQSRIK